MIKPGTKVKVPVKQPLWFDDYTGEYEVIATDIDEDLKQLYGEDTITVEHQTFGNLVFVKGEYEVLAE